MNDLADLAELDHELGRVGRDDEQIGVCLDEDPGFFFIAFAQALAGFDRLGDQGFKVCGVGDAGAVAARAAEVGQSV